MAKPRRAAQARQDQRLKDRQFPNIPWNWVGLAGTLALQERHAEAAEALAAIRPMMPIFTPSWFYWGAQFISGQRFRDDVKGDYRRLRDAINAGLR